MASQPAGRSMSSKQIKKKKVHLTNQDIIMIQVWPPTRCRLKKCSRKYTIKFKYYAKKDPNKKIKTKTINFGHVLQDDYVNHKDRQRRRILMSRIRNYDTPFKSNFWRVYLLNGEKGSLMENYLAVLSLYGLNS